MLETVSRTRKFGACCFREVRHMLLMSSSYKRVRNGSVKNK